MIHADARSRITGNDLHLVIQCLTDLRRTSQEDATRLVEREGLDDILDDAPLGTALLAVPLPGPSASLLFYVLIRQALVAHGIADRRLADYCAALLREFGGGRRAFRIAQVDDQEHFYVVDILRDANTSHDPRAFRALVHLGNYTLWLAGLFPDRIAAREIRRGGPNLAYYEAMGHRGYAVASDHALADRAGLADVYRLAADRFGDVRQALTTVGGRLALRPAA